ncbi:DUF3995 domain-containing protein [Actinomadura logoneensis]|uniref:DUF3995 domain-containing protein n=1 Tax=Actinomadura logoneensis TaxID=2293572 RepID=A0A372JRE1_9ACTN|nr:DUF3995 domain-containing protein [Actinomadura logoneensis]RFU42603.1 DUF3995 domain-containing protein [Actinomadura logoneensis]
MQITPARLVRHPASTPVTGRVAAYAAALWGLLFSLVHVYWLADGRLGLPDGRSIYGTPALLVIDVIAIPASLGAAGLALALVRPWGGRLPGRMVRAAVWGTTALLVLHALPSVPDWIALASGMRHLGDLSAEERFATFVYEPWFLTGGVLFGLATGAMRGRPPA